MRCAVVKGHDRSALRWIQQASVQDVKRTKAQVNHSLGIECAGFVVLNGLKSEVLEDEFFLRCHSTVAMPPD